MVILFIVKGEYPINSTISVNMPGDTSVTVKFPRLSVVAPLMAFILYVRINYSRVLSGMSDKESITLSVILALASVFFYLRIIRRKYS